METMKIKVYSPYEINRMGLNFKLKCFKVLPNGDKCKLCKDIVITIDDIFDKFSNSESNALSYGIVNQTLKYEDWTDVIKYEAPDGFYYDRLIASYVAVDDLSMFNKCILVEKGRYFVSPEDSVHNEVKTDVYLVHI